MRIATRHEQITAIYYMISRQTIESVTFSVF